MIERAIGIKVDECVLIHKFPTVGKISENNFCCFQQRRDIFQIILVKNIRILISPEGNIELSFPVYPKETVVTRSVKENDLGGTFDPFSVVFFEVDFRKDLVERYLGFRNRILPFSSRSWKDSLIRHFQLRD